MGAVTKLVEAAGPRAREMLEHADRLEEEKTVRDLEASIRTVRIDKARAAYEAAKQRILSWAPGDVRAANDVLSEALGAADRLIEALEG